MARYILTGNYRRRLDDPGLHASSATVYISHNGCTTFNAERCAVLRSLSEAKEEADYWRVNQPKFHWTIEELPRGPVAAAVLRARPVDTELAR